MINQPVDIYWIVTEDVLLAPKIWIEMLMVTRKIKIK